jgi:hypothetical protein
MSETNQPSMPLFSRSLLSENSWLSTQTKIKQLLTDGKTTEPAPVRSAISYPTRGAKIPE